jgi:hypothetical protein
MAMVRKKHGKLKRQVPKLRRLTTVARTQFEIFKSELPKRATPDNDA